MEAEKPVEAVKSALADGVRCVAHRVSDRVFPPEEQRRDSDLRVHICASQKSIEKCIIFVLLKDG